MPRKNLYAEEPNACIGHGGWLPGGKAVHGEHEKAAAAENAESGAQAVARWDVTCPVIVDEGEPGLALAARAISNKS